MAGPRVRQHWQPIHFGKDDSLSVLTGYTEALLVSQSNPRINGNYVGGGAFYCVRVRRDLKTGPKVRHTRLGTTWAGTIGPAWTGLPNAKQLAGYLTSNRDNVASALGVSSWSKAAADVVATGGFSTGYARTRPGNPIAGLGQFLIELREFPSLYGASFSGVNWNTLSSIRYLPGSLKRLPFRDWPQAIRAVISGFRSLGSEYLNHVFGWAPFVNDLREVYHLSKRIDKEMAQIVKDNRKGIRRGTTLRDDSETTTSTASKPYPMYTAGPPNWTGLWGTETSAITQTVKYWYVAKYSYYIPDTNSWAWNARARAALFGALPSPGLLWEVLPFSWMSDWFSTMGDVMNNASANAVDNLVAHYAYLMRHTRQVSTCTNSGAWDSWQINSATPTDIPGGSFSVTGRGLVETKMRLPLFPGLVFFPGSGTGSGFSARQLGVLAALGLTRVPN